MKKPFNQKEIDNLMNNLFVASINQTIDHLKNVTIEIVFDNNCKLSTYLYAKRDGYTFRNLEIEKDSSLTDSERTQLNRYLDTSHCKTFPRVKTAKSFIYSFINEFKDILSECRYKFISIFDHEETYFGEELCDSLADHIYVSNNYKVKQNFRSVVNDCSSINVLCSLVYRPDIHFTSEYMAINKKHLVTKKGISEGKTVYEESIMLDSLEDVYKFILTQIEIEYKKSEIDEGFRFFDDSVYKSMYGYRYSVGKISSIGENRRAFNGDVEKTSRKETLYFDGNFKQEICIDTFTGGKKIFYLVVKEYEGNENSEWAYDPDVVLQDFYSEEEAIQMAGHIAKNGVRKIKDFKDILKKMWALGELKNQYLKNIKSWIDEHSDEDMSLVFSSLLRTKRIAEMEVNIAEMYSTAVNNGYNENYNEFFKTHIDNTVILNTNSLPISLEDRSNMSQKEIVETTQLDLVNKMIDLLD